VNDKRRDFRLVIGKINGKCPFPASIGIKGVCIAPYLWHSKEIQRTGDKFTAQVDIPKGKNRWVGYFIEMQYKSDIVLDSVQTELLPKSLQYY
jgi:hypothetical protein